MNTKIVTVAVVALVVVIAIGAVALMTNSDTESNQYVKYYGNGGSLEDGTTEYNIAETTVESCLYTKNGSAFSSWNTKADGTGVKYNVGDTVSLGTKLYAQWVDNVLHVASYTVISSYPSTSLKVMMVSEIGSHSMFISTPFTSPAFIVLSGVTDIFYDQTASMFKYTDNGVKCTVKVTLTNADNVRYSIDEGNGVVYFSATKDIGVDLNIKKVISG